MQNLAVVNVITGIGRLVELGPALFRESLETEAERPHDLAVTDDDDSPIGALAVEGIQYAVDAQTEARHRLSAHRHPEEGADVVELHLFGIPLLPFIVGHGVHLTPLPLAQIEVGEPLRTLDF